eukprot:4683859-Pyramimonas_sp.AAC.1
MGSFERERRSPEFEPLSPPPRPRCGSPAGAAPRGGAGCRAALGPSAAPTGMDGALGGARAGGKAGRNGVAQNVKE